LENGREIAQANEAAQDFKIVVETVVIFKYYCMKDNVKPRWRLLPIKPLKHWEGVFATARIGQIVHDTSPDFDSYISLWLQRLVVWSSFRS
jgi:hypothetical protein